MAANSFSPSISRVCCLVLWDGDFIWPSHQNRPLNRPLSPIGQDEQNLHLAWPDGMANGEAWPTQYKMHWRPELHKPWIPWDPMWTQLRSLWSSEHLGQRERKKGLIYRNYQGYFVKHNLDQITMSHSWWDSLWSEIPSTSPQWICPH